MRFVLLPFACVAALLGLLLVAPPRGEAASQGGCRAAGLCCQGKNMTCRVAPGKDQLEVVKDEKRRPPMCFCDSACLDLSDCCFDYKDACQGRRYLQPASSSPPHFKFS